jgi:hypothetical protein
MSYMDAYDELLTRAVYHFQMTDKQTKQSAVWATIFRWGIPI